MIIELVSFLGTSVGGRMFGMLNDVIKHGAARKEQALLDKHRRKLIRMKAKGDFLERIHETNDNGYNSPFSWAIVFILVMLAVTYCYATLTCFTENPGGIVFTKDPAEGGKRISIFFGFIEWDRSNNRVTSMSRAGLGYIMLHPIIFILSMVTTGDGPTKRR